MVLRELRSLYAAWLEKDPAQVLVTLVAVVMFVMNSFFSLLLRDSYWWFWFSLTLIVVWVFVMSLLINNSK